MNRRLRIPLHVALALLPAALLFAWLRLHRPPPKTAPMPDRVVRLPAVNPGPAPAPTPDAASTSSSAGNVARATWTALDEHRYEDAIRQLRAAGCPEETIRDIVVMQLTRHTLERLLSNARAVTASTPWWRSSNGEGTRFQREAQAARAEVSSEAARLLGRSWRELLAEYFPAYGTLPPDFLSAEHRAALGKLGSETQERIAAVRARAGSAGFIDDALKSEIVAIRREHREAVTQLLSPAELADFDVRESATGNFVLGHLPEAKSETEFRAMVRAAQATGIDFEALLDIDPAEMADWQQRRGKAVKAVLDKFAASESPERAAEIARLDAEREATEKAAEARRNEEAEARNEAEMLTQITDAARSANATVENAKAFIDAIKARQSEWQSREKEMLSKPGGRAQFEREFRSMMNTLATEHFGPNGPEVLKKLPGWKSE